jgi:8-oxo-dGTP pyrophosphatase MutT (NUDIX family)
MSFLDRIAECNSADLSRYRRFYVEKTLVGWVRDDRVRLLMEFPNVFHVNAKAIRLAPQLNTPARRGAAVERALRKLHERGAFRGWRGEPYTVSTGFAAPPLLTVERAAVPFLGVRAYGVHLNGIVRDKGGLKMWVARRSRKKETYPGLLDNMVAGGQPVGISLIDNLVKECAEEAGIPEHLARRAVPVGTVTYNAEVPEGYRPDVQFCFDLELPHDFAPVPHDGEAEAFELKPIGEVALLVRDTRQFKFNCNLVVIDFLVRHGILPPDHPDYVAIVGGLRQ